MGALHEAVCAWDLLKEAAIIFINSTIVREGTESSTEVGLKIY